MALYLGIKNNGTFITADGYVLQDSNGLSLTALPSTNKQKIILGNIMYRVNTKFLTKESE
jgi:hypothetical protein